MKQLVVDQRGEIIREGWDFYYGFGVLTNPGKNVLKLQLDSPIQHERITGVQVRRRTNDASRTPNDNPIVNDAVFLSTHLLLKQRNAEVFTDIPLELIWFATQQGLYYPIDIPSIDMSQSEVRTSSQANLVANEEFYFVFKYLNEIIKK